MLPLSIHTPPYITPLQELPAGLIAPLVSSDSIIVAPPIFDSSGHPWLNHALGMNPGLSGALAEHSLSLEHVTVDEMRHAPCYASQREVAVFSDTLRPFSIWLWIHHL